MRLWLLALAIALVPCLPLKQVSPTSMRWARDICLLGLLGFGALWAVTWAPPFAQLAPALAWWWTHPPTTPYRSARDVAGSVIIWVGLAGLWAGLAGLEPLAWGLIRAVWIGVACVAVGWCAVQWYWIGKYPPEWDPEYMAGRPVWHPYRPFNPAFAWFGQRTLTAAFFAMVLPLCPPALVWVPVLGLGITCSWAAILAGALAAIMLWPWVAVPFGATVTLAVVVGWARPAWLDWTPRGGSLDSIRLRWQVLRLAGPAMLRPAWLPWGYGPRSMETATQRWAAVLGGEVVPVGMIHCDPLQFVFEYGVSAIAALGVLGWLVLPKLTLGDPWSAAWVAGTVLALASVHVRIWPTALVWFALTVQLTTR